MIYDKIKALDSIPFHTPGHKRNTELLGINLPYDIDITEINGFDNLHSPNGILSALNKKLSKLYNAKESYALVNGSTVGILSAVNAVVKQGDTVLMARNCHKSVYNAIEIAKAKSEYVMPDYDEYGIAKGIRAEQVEEKLNNKVRLIVITSPTYEGVESEVDKICELAHKFDIPVLVDAAHGAHFFKSYHKADIVIRSLHKTLPALTQCAVANIYGDLIDSKKIQIKLSVFETSSPSYVLLSSIDKCVDYISNNSFESYYKTLNRFYNTNLKNLKLIKYDDECKIVIFTGFSNISGFELADKLRNYNIEPEMTAGDYVIALSTICDRPESLYALKQALLSIDKTLIKSDYSLLIQKNLPAKHCESFEIKQDSQEVVLSESVGKISSEYIWAYPPGIPLLVPGEIIDKNTVDYIRYNRNIDFQSTFGCLPQKIYCQKV